MVIIYFGNRNLADLCDGILDVTYHNRRLKDTCVSDIIAWLLELQKIDKVPYFVVDHNGIARLPTFNIDDVTNVALCERLGRPLLDGMMLNPIELLALRLAHKAVLRRDVLYLFLVLTCQVPNIRQNPVM